MKVLITGGLGFIGSVTARMLSDKGHEVTVIDNNSDPVGYSREALKVPGVDIVEGDIREESFLKNVFRVSKPDAVCHFAALSRVGEGERLLSRFLDVNVTGTARLLEAMKAAGTKRLLFASTSSVYGAVEGSAHEGAPVKPESWYGKTKVWAEEVIHRFVRSSGLYGFIFRFANVAGAGYGVYEDRPEDDRVIPKTVHAGLSGDVFQVYGADWPTPDGTCIRDYIHVLDIAKAFLMAIEGSSGTRPAEPMDTINLGCARPVSVKEIIQTTSQVTGLSIRSAKHDRRAGDVASIWLPNQRAFAALRWEPTRGLSSMIEDYWKARKEAVIG